MFHASQLEHQCQPCCHVLMRRMDLKPLHSHSHAMEGFAMDWSPVKAGRLATGDCRKSIHVWEPQEGGRWQVSTAIAPA